MKGELKILSAQQDFLDFGKEISQDVVDQVLVERQNLGDLSVVHLDLGVFVLDGREELEIVLEEEIIVELQLNEFGPILLRLVVGLGIN